METKILKAEIRKIEGRKVKKLRKEGLLPGNVFGKGVKSTSIQVQLSDFEKVHKEVGETGLVELNLGKDKRPTLVHNVQKDPVTNIPLHVDFLQVDLKQKVVASVPVEVTGESPAEKQGIGTAVQYINEIEVEALPVDLPEKFLVDVSKLEEVNQAIYVKDLNYSKSKVEIKADLEAIVVKVEPPQKIEEVAPSPVVEEEVPAEAAPVEEGADTSKEKEEVKTPETTSKEEKPKE